MRRLWKIHGAVSAVAGAALFLSAAPASAGITLDVSKVVPATGQLPRFKLGNQTGLADALVTKILGNLGGLKLEALAQSQLFVTNKIQASGDLMGAIDGEHVVALVDKATGDINVMPTLSKLKPLVPSIVGQIAPVTQPILDLATQTAGGVLADVGVFGKDDTQAVLGKVATLFTAQSKKGAVLGALTNAGPILLTVPVLRKAGGLDVFGVGSRGLLHFGADGKVLGLLRIWKTASKVDVVTESRSAADIAAAINAQLAVLGKTADVTVLDVQVGLFDSNKGFIQPVYRFAAKVVQTVPTGKVSKVDPDFIVGYVPIGKVLEPIPSLLDKIDPLPVLRPGSTVPITSIEPQGLPQFASAPASKSSEPLIFAANDVNPILSDASSQGPDPTVSRYVVRADYSGWVNSANIFYNGIQNSGYGGYFSFPQYYWAEPRLYTSQKNYFVNSTHVNDTEAHGDWWYFTTYQNWGDGVNINGDIPYPGYGPAAGGSLAYWAIHSCEVVPSAADTGSWPNPWWTVFGGLHTVAGYRTIMWIDDGSTYNFGRWIGQGYSVVNSWLSAVASSPYFHWGPSGSGGGQVMHGTWKYYNVPSTISQCNRQDDWVYNAANYGRADSTTGLCNYWYN